MFYRISFMSTIGEDTMSEATGSHGQAPPVVATPLRADLRARIGWICHALRIAAVIWIGWVAVMTVVAWSDKAQVLQNYGRLFSTDLSDVSAARYAAAIVVVILSVASAVSVVICIWRLASTYLAGSIFTVDATIWLRRTAIAGLAAIVVSVIARVVVASILTGQLVPLSPLGFYYVLPQDVLHLIFVIFVLAVAHIFKAAAEMADDHARIV
jgi:DUF2975 family protein